MFVDDGSTGPTAEEAAVEIVLKRLNEDGTTDELQLEGDLGDAQAVASTLEGEGNCVTVEIAQPEEDDVEGVPGASEEKPGASEEAPGPSEETPESGDEASTPAEVQDPVSP
jgi:hypothetical protein